MGHIISLYDDVSGTLWWREKCFFHVRLKAHHSIGADELDPYFEVAEQVLSSREVGPCQAPLLIDRSQPFTIQFGVRTRLARWAHARISAIAWYAPNAMAQVAARHAQEVFAMHGYDEERMNVCWREPQTVRWLMRQVTHDTADALSDVSS